MQRTCGGILLLAFSGSLGGSPARGQSPTPPSPPAFEVASVKPYEGPLNRLLAFSSSGPRARYLVYTIGGLIREAYDLQHYQLTFSPSVRREEAYDPYYYNIEAKAPGDGPRTRAEFRQMLQMLLAERFNVKVHHETREISVYALVVRKDGPKFKESAPEAKWVSNHGVNGRKQNVTASQYKMLNLADDLQDFGLDRPVIDKTGLTGTYDFKLEATPQYRLDSAEPGDIDIFTAVKQQLGLTLEAQRAMVEVLVVDHLERPSAN